MASATSFVPPQDHDSFDNLEKGKLFEDQTLTTSAIQPAGFRENHTHNATRVQTGNAGGGQKESSEKESLLLTIQSEQNTNDPCTNSHEQNDIHPKRQPLDKWPDPLDDESALERNLLQPLQRDVGQAKNIVEENGKITVRSVTWNQHAQDFPTIQTLREQLLLPSYFHLVVVGTQECENTIAKSLLYPSKVNWEKHCLDALGFDYELVRGHSLQASHLALYAHRSIVHLLSEVDSTAVATGLCDKLGNKGGIAIKVKIGKTKFCFLTAHLSAYQHQMSKRTFEFLKISKEVSRAFGHVAIESSTEEGMMDDSTSSASYYEDQRPKLVVASVNKKVDLFEDNCLDKENPRLRRADTSTTLACSFCSTCSRSIRQCRVCCNPGRIKNDKYNPLLDAFDHVIWCGDFNFRIHGTRDIVDTLLKKNRCDVLLHNDQLTMLMQYDKAFKGFKEGPVTFRPTYKFDKLSDKYDTSSKRRIPAWTDRIIFKENSRIELLSYCSARNLRISDHRPVYASFRCFFNLDDTENRRELQPKELMRSESRSEVCVIS